MSKFKTSVLCAVSIYNLSSAFTMIMQENLGQYSLLSHRQYSLHCIVFSLLMLVGSKYRKSDGDVFKFYFLQSRYIDGQSSNHVVQVGWV